ncbi:eCIS core domain-containing protein [Streptomyces sp. DW26H14]|uniref:eCIS core domain-containing protein n=1 Tax=Streptomyces sp. DW26H14 TaxID=3435395 RepID=UPI00403DAFEB
MMRKESPDQAQGVAAGAARSPRPGAAPQGPGGLLGLQRSAGNAAVVLMLRQAVAADATADPSEEAGPDLGSVIKGVTSRGGRPLRTAQREKAESVFKEDFSAVRLHTDTVAQRSAADLQARAYTVGDHIVSGTGDIDDKTLFHELTHVSDQRKGPVAGTDHGDGTFRSSPDDPFERKATANERLADSSPVAPELPSPGHHSGDGHAHHGAVQRTAAGPATVQRAPAGTETTGQTGKTGGTQHVRRRVLVVCDESGQGLGGVPVFNMELVKGLRHDHDVTLLTVNNRENYDHAKTVKQHDGAPVINVLVPDLEEGRERLVQLVASNRPEAYGLPAARDAFDMIIGHSRFSGPAAELMCFGWYPSARLVHFLHTSPVRLDKIKGEPEKGGRKARTERQVMREADLVSGVGPLLTKEAERLSQQIFRVPAVHEFVPGTEVKTPLVHSAPPPRRLDLLLPGRATDAIKGVRAAVTAIGMLRRPQSLGGYGLDVRLTIRGGPNPKKDPEAYAKWQNLVTSLGAGGVTLLPFTPNPEDLDKDREGKDAVIMPSLHEGFGLVVTEGAGNGVPVLVNGESGAAEFLQQFQALAGHMVVDAPYNVDPASGKEAEGGEEQRAKAWAEAIATLQSRLPAARGDAAQLHEILTRYTWRHAAQALVEAAMATAAPGTGPNHGAVTRQGPDGTVEQLGQRTDWAPTHRWDGSTPQPRTGGPTQAQLLQRLAVIRQTLGLTTDLGGQTSRRSVRRTNSV